MSQIVYQSKDKPLDHSIKHPSKGIGIQTLFLLHRELHLNFSWHIRHGRALEKTPDFKVVYIKYQQMLDKRQNVLGSISPLKIG